MKKKIALGVFLLLIASWFVWANTYTFNVEKATTHLTENAYDTSHHVCAWYVMRALHAGGCPAIILPAQWYSWFMPAVGFKRVSKKNYEPQAGDVVVFQRPKFRKKNGSIHLWGHIAMYNGKQWISDFKQKKMNPYGREVPYKLFRCKRQK